MENVKIDDQLKPLAFFEAVLFFAIPSAIITCLLFIGIGLLTEAGWAPFIIFNVVFVVPLACLFGVALFAYRLEGNSWTWDRFRVRMRLHALRGYSEWLWTLALALLWVPISINAIYPVVLGVAVLAILAEGIRGKQATKISIVVALFVACTAFAPQLLRPLSSVVFYSMPTDVTDFMNQIQPASFFGIPLAGQWWLPFFFLVAMFFNIFGEELLWRGFILPRQELAHGSWTWIIHGLLWTGFHIF